MTSPPEKTNLHILGARRQEISAAFAIRPPQGGMTFRGIVLLKSLEKVRMSGVRLLILIATTVIAVPGVGSAQSVLERVLGQIDGATNLAQVNGSYANIAESIGQYSPPIEVSETREVTYADYISSDYIGNPIVGRLYQAGSGTMIRDVYASDLTDGSYIIPADTFLNNWAGDRLANAGEEYTLPNSAIVYNLSGFLWFFEEDRAVNPDWGFAVLQDFTILVPGTTLSTAIDGSITNVISGVTSATQEAVAGVVSATEWSMPTFDLGDMATTALGAVNTGEIALGVNSAVDEASTATTNAISAVVDQIGGSADTGALVLNVASNASAVNGSINNVVAEVNGSIGNLSTTALGAVNTGTIVSGVDAAVTGIVGMSGQSGL